MRRRTMCSSARSVFIAASALALVALFAPPAHGQSFQGGVRGTLKDAQGVIPGVNVVLINVATGQTRETLANPRRIRNAYCVFWEKIAYSLGAFASGGGGRGRAVANNRLATLGKADGRIYLGLCRGQRRRVLDAGCGGSRVETDRGAACGRDGYVGDATAGA